MAARTPSLPVFTTAVVLAVLFWVALSMTVSYWWAIEVRPNQTAGSIGFVLGELWLNFPTLVYFFVVGAVSVYIFGSQTGAKLSLLAVAISLCISAALTRWIFPSGIGLFAVITLATHFLAPFIAACAGVFSSRFLLQPKNHARTL